MEAGGYGGALVGRQRAGDAGKCCGRECCRGERPVGGTVGAATGMAVAISKTMADGDRDVLGIERFV